MKKKRKEEEAALKSYMRELVCRQVRGWVNRLLFRAVRKEGQVGKCGGVPEPPRTTFQQPSVRIFPNSVFSDIVVVA